jgi:hypothetical protein
MSLTPSPRLSDLEREAYSLHPRSMARLCYSAEQHALVVPNDVPTSRSWVCLASDVRPCTIPSRMYAVACKRCYGFKIVVRGPKMSASYDLFRAPGDLTYSMFRLAEGQARLHSDIKYPNLSVCIISSGASPVVRPI